MKEKLKAVVFRGVKDIHIEEFDIPKIEDDELLIKVDSCAICTWEQRVYTGVKKVNYPFVGGHETVGKIIQMGDKVNKAQWHIDDKVAVGLTGPCNNCYQCKSGNEQNCENYRHDALIRGLPYRGMGGLCSHMVVKEKNIFKLNNNVKSTHGTITEPLSCVIHSVETANIQFGDTVVIIGCGIMGLLHTILAEKKGAMVVVSDINEERTNLALKLGAKHKINPSKENLQERIRELTDANMAQVVFNTTPISSVVNDAIKITGNNGRIILYSSFYPDIPVEFSPDWLHKGGIKIMGTANSNTVDFTKASRMISQETVNMEPFISEVYQVDKVKEAFESAIKGDKFRVVVKF